MTLKKLRWYTYILATLLIPIVTLGSQGANISVAGPTSGTDLRLKEISSRQGADAIINVDFEKMSINDALLKVAELAGVKLNYASKDVRSDKLITLKISNVTFRAAVSKILEGTDLKLVERPDGQLIIVPGSGGSKPEQETQRTGSVSGRVTDSVSGEGVEGVTISIAGIGSAVIADHRGRFSLSRIPLGKHLITFKLLGFKTVTRTVTITDSRPIVLEVDMSRTPSVMSGVVTTATGQQRRMEVGSDIVKIDMEDLTRRAPIRSVTDALIHANIPGVQVTPSSGEPGAPARIRMRGVSSLTGDNDPAIIVDGVWVNAAISTERAANQAIPGTQTDLVPSRLDDIDPETIESIEIIRGPSAATLYGQEAANGVIVITTKRGTPGTARWSLTANRNWSNLPGNVPPRWLGYGRISMSETFTRCNVADVVRNNCIQDSVVNMAAHDEFLTRERRSSADNYSLSLEGGVNQLNYRLSGSISDNLGNRTLPMVDRVRMRRLLIPVEPSFLMPTMNKKRSLDLRLGFQPQSTLSLDLAVAGVNTRNRSNVVETTPSFLWDDRDTLNLSTDPNLRVNKRDAGSERNSASVNIGATWIPTAWVRGNAQFAISKGSRNDNSFIQGRLCSFGQCSFSNRGRVQAYSEDEAEQTGRLSASFTPRISRMERYVRLQPGFGLDIRRLDISGIRLDARTILNGSSSISDAESFAGDGRLRKTVTAGWYANTNVRLLQRFFFDVGLRQDVGSAVRATNAATLPKLSTSWVLSEEPFFPVTDLLSSVRLRFAFGHASKHPQVGDIHGSFTVNDAFIDGRWIQVYNLSSIGNYRLVPERSVEYETGIDMDMLYDRLALSLTYANKNTRNNIVPRRIPPSTGFAQAARMENIGRVVNRSMEFSMTARVIDNSSVTWTVSANMAGLDNYVARVGDRVSVNMQRGSSSRIAAGYPVTGLWKRPVMGFGDANEDGFISADEIVFGDTAEYIGSSSPRFSAGYQSYLQLFNGRLTFAAGLTYQGSHIQSIHNYDGYGLEAQQASLEEQALALLLRSESGAEALSGGVQLPVTSLRLNSASVGFILPDKIATRIKARDAQIFLQGSNLGLWTNYRGRDPSVNSMPLGESLRDDGNIVPLPRSFVLRLVLRF